MSIKYYVNSIYVYVVQFMYCLQCFEFLDVDLISSESTLSGVQRLCSAPFQRMRVKLRTYRYSDARVSKECEAEVL
jgi:hypothetical protein